MNEYCHYSLIKEADSFFDAKLSVDKKKRIILNLDFERVPNKLKSIINADAGPIMLETRIRGLGEAETFDLKNAAELSPWSRDLSGLEGIGRRALEVRVAKFDTNGKIEWQWWSKIRPSSGSYDPDNLRCTISQGLSPGQTRLDWNSENLTIYIDQTLGEALDRNDPLARRTVMDRILVDLLEETTSGPAYDRFIHYLQGINQWPRSKSVVEWISEIQREIFK